ncbi:arylsulfatase L-like [Amphibalanus amphitrite]|uniref:arylsulfatase L-like n=1 Tax=Amphibalanus amphitrite TaxID=1232801 RepID=UPI001C9018F8|nr:arylsulfatase L-like [Amphibalanus amphitrite]
MASTVIGLLVLLGVFISSSAEPNIVVLLANNVRADDLSCFNPGTPVQTPNIDRLAAGGALLQHHTVPALTLTANRAAHITGQLPFRYGLQESEDGVRQILHTLSRAGLPVNTQTYAEVFKKFGYRTKAAGSWELGWGCRSWADHCHGPLQHGFDSFYGVPLSGAPASGGHLSYSQLVPMRALEAYLAALANRTDLRDIYQPIAETAWYQWLALAAHDGRGAGAGGKVRTLEERAMLTESLRHQLDALLVRDDAVERWPYTLQGMTLPILSESLEFIRDNHRARRPFLLQHTFLHVHEPSIAAPHRVGASNINPYYDGILELDWAVGRVLDQLEKLDILDNTVVYFASDYNDLMSFRSSVSNITDSRVPGIFLWPGTLQPHVMRQPTSVLDLLPTLIDIIGRGEELLNMTIDGRSLFFSSADPWRDQSDTAFQLQRTPARQRHARLPRGWRPVHLQGVPVGRLPALPGQDGGV